MPVLRSVIGFGMTPRPADLTDADLSGAYLNDAKVAPEQLDQAKLAKGTTMPNGQKYEEWLKDRRADR